MIQALEEAVDSERRQASRDREETAGNKAASPSDEGE
jgi:hypothetical protein